MTLEHLSREQKLMIVSSSVWRQAIETPMEPISVYFERFGMEAATTGMRVL